MAAGPQANAGADLLGTAYEVGFELFGQIVEALAEAVQTATHIGYDGAGLVDGLAHFLDAGLCAAAFLVAMSFMVTQGERSGVASR